MGKYFSKYYSVTSVVWSSFEDNFQTSRQVWLSKTIFTIKNIKEWTQIFQTLLLCPSTGFMSVQIFWARPKIELHLVWLKNIFCLCKRQIY